MGERALLSLLTQKGGFEHDTLLPKSFVGSLSKHSPEQLHLCAMRLGVGLCGPSDILGDILALLRFDILRQS